MPICQDNSSVQQNNLEIHAVGQGRPAKHCRNRKVCTQKSSVCARMYPAETKEKQYQINKKIPCSKPPVCTRYILLSSSTVTMMYFKTYISVQYVLLLVCTGNIISTYLRKKVCTRYIYGEKVCTEYTQADIPVYHDVGFKL